MTRNVIDVSNYTQPFTLQQVQFLKDNHMFVTIGLQVAASARAFKKQCVDAGLTHDYYVDKLGRDLTIPEPGTEVYIDVEPGCFVDAPSVEQAIVDILNKGLSPAIYGNKTSIQPVIGTSPQWSTWPLWYANYPNDHHVPAQSEFVPFNGWTTCEGWQYSSLGIAGINCDLSVYYVDAPVPQPHFVRFESQVFLSDGTHWNVTGTIDPPP